MRRAVVAAVTLACGLAIACDVPPGAVDRAACAPTNAIAPDAPFGSPDDLAIEGCVAGGMLDFDPFAVYSMAGASTSGARVRFVEACDGGMTTTTGGRAMLSPDALHWTVARPEFEVAAAGLVCKTADGLLVGRVATCFQDECFTAFVEASRFGWPETAEARGMTLVGELDPSHRVPPGAAGAYDVRVDRGVAYLLLPAGLMLVDVADPAAPRELAWFAAAGAYLNDVDAYDAADGRRTAIVTGASQHILLDVEEPRAPRELRRLSIDGGHTVTLETVAGATRAYLSSSSSEVVVLDVSRPRAPIVLGRWPGVVHDMAVRDHVGYLNATVAGFEVVDFTDPAAPLRLGARPGVGYSHATALLDIGDRRYAVHGDEGMGSFLQVIDVDPASPEFLATVGSRAMRPDVSVHNLAVVGHHAYVAWYQNGVRVLDLADPREPREIAHFNTWQADRSRAADYEGAFTVDVDEATGLVYVADDLRGLVILRLDAVQD